jgi:hypothetical protein
MMARERKWTIELTCVGLQFRWTKSGRETLARSCPFPVDLEREPDNEHDENAVKVVIAADYKLKKLRGKHLGYLRRQAAEHMAPRLDAGTLEVVKLWVTNIDPAMAEATIDARFRDIPPKLKKVSTKAKKKVT